MADLALKNAQALRADLEQQIMTLSGHIADLNGQLVELHRNLALVDDFIDLHDQYAKLGMSAPQAADEGVPLPPVPPPSTSKKLKNPPHQRVAEEAVEIIEKAGQPVSSEAMHSMLAQRGLLVVGKDPLATMSTMLWRHKEDIVRLKGHGYWLAKAAYAPARYFPQDVFS